MDGWGLLKGSLYVPSLKNRKKKVCWFESALKVAEHSFAGGQR